MIAISSPSACCDTNRHSSESGIGVVGKDNLEKANLRSFRKPATC